MTLCANHKCRRPLHSYEWPGGACSLACSREIDAMYDGAVLDLGQEAGGQARPDADAMAALQAAADVDRRGPLVMLLLARGWAYRRIAARVGCHEKQVRRIVENVRTHATC